MTNKYVGAAKFFANLITGGKQKTTGTEVIKNFPIAKNLTTKRNIQDKVVEAVDEGVKKADVPPSVKASQSTKQSASEMKRKKSKELKGLSYRLDKLQEKVENKAKGSRIGRKFGSPKPKTNIEKIKETFSPKKNLSPKQMKIAKLAGNPNKIDAADLKKLRNR